MTFRRAREGAHTLPCQETDGEPSLAEGVVADAVLVLVLRQPSPSVFGRTHEDRAREICAMTAGITLTAHFLLFIRMMASVPSVGQPTIFR